ncbi:MAG TPA: DUF424 domain-containing protein [Methanoregulaceae archaeon]|nr:DUF424 domain-containing protein [Methanoregulaceae archaeon]
MYLKIHRSPDGDQVVAVCDHELLNTRVRRGELEICISEGFYGNRLSDADEVRSVLKMAGNVNLMGERVVALAVDMGLIERSNCFMFGTVPHAQVFRL